MIIAPRLAKACLPSKSKVILGIWAFRCLLEANETQIECYQAVVENYGLEKIKQTKQNIHEMLISKQIETNDIESSISSLNTAFEILEKKYQQEDYEFFCKILRYYRNNNKCNKAAKIIAAQIDDMLR